MFSIFFFQAEDGIRDLVRSRGLGDVYKRQVRSSDHVQAKRLRIGPRIHDLEVSAFFLLPPAPLERVARFSQSDPPPDARAVSYLKGNVNTGACGQF